jgi:Domain of unknown function (DUF4153)
MPMQRASARRLLLVALACGVLFDVLVPGSAPGLNASLILIALLVAAFAAAGRDGIRRFDPADAWMPPAALALAAMVAVRADPWLVLVDLAFAAALTAGSIASLAGMPITRGVVERVVESAAVVMAASVAGAIVLAGAAVADEGQRRTLDGAAPTGIRSRGPEARRRLGRRLSGLLPVARGLLFALPVLVLFGLLFAAADAVFASVARSALAWHPDVDLANVGDRAIVIGLVAWPVAGLLALSGGRLPALVAGPGSGGRPAGSRSLGAASVADLGAGPPAGSIEAATVLIVVDGLFAVFVALQAAYLFGGHDTLAVAGMTYADYARRGFFELVAVAVLAVLMVVALDLAVARRARPQLAAALVLLGLTAVVLASAWLRLRLYQDAYGWTELRFVVASAIAWLAVALVVVGGLVAIRRTRWTLHAMGIMVLLTLGAMNVVGPQAFVADRNLERAIDPALVPSGGRTGLDADYLTSLGDEAVPAVVAAYDRLGSEDRRRLTPFLQARAGALGADPSLTGWPAWNLARQRAREALAGWVAGRATGPGTP